MDFFLPLLCFLLLFDFSFLLDENTDSKTKSKLNELKETLVITTGDNYVGAAKRQLREKMADLYSKIASGYDRPSPMELENFNLIKDMFQTAFKTFDKLKKKVKVEDLNLKSYEDFISG